MIWEVDCDFSVWLPVPVFGPDAVAAAETWRAETVRNSVEYFGTDFDLDADYPAQLRTQLDHFLICAARYDEGGLGELYVHRPRPDVEPGFVLVNVQPAEADDPDYLLDVTGARGCDTIGLPTVDYLTTPGLGDGVRVLRYEQDDELGVIATLMYAWRVAAVGADAIVMASSSNVGQLAAMTPDIENLVTAISVTADGA